MIRRRIVLLLFVLFFFDTNTSLFCLSFSDTNPNIFWRKNSISSSLNSEQESLPPKKSGYTTDVTYSSYLRSKEEFLGQWKERAQMRKEFLEDGYADLCGKPTPFYKKILRYPYRLFQRMYRPKDPGTLILIRHGQSLWNANQTFTGWADPDLSQKGHREAEHAARLLLEGGYEIDVVFTSRLKRAIRTARIILQELNEVYLPVFKSWRLQERNYGALTGLSKKETAEELGADLIQEWRGSYHARPPALKRTDTYWPGNDRKYADLSDDEIPLTESLEDCMLRTSPVWETRIKRELRKGRNVLVVAHANTLRGLVKTIDGISDDDIQDVALPTGVPMVYKFDQYFKPLDPDGPSQIHTNGLFLEKPTLLKDALTREAEWANNVPGYDSTMARPSRKTMSSLELSLNKLNAERALGEWAGQFITAEDEEDDGSDGNQGKPIQILEATTTTATAVTNHSSSLTTATAAGKNNEAATAEGKNKDDETTTTKITPNIVQSSPCVASLPAASVVPGIGSIPIRKDAVLVIIRHGKTEHNKLKLFTGWEDAPLAMEGIEEAKEAGRLLKLHGFEFDVVYTSWLSRAIETAWHVMDEMDELWLPLIKTWRLNERMYGMLTGLSKRMVAQRHGEKKFMAWRRGYNTPPPKVSSFSPHYPGNDKRYNKYLNDVRFSLKESLIRSIESGRITLRRKLPKSESLKDCMDRTIPFFTERIIPEALDQGKRVLISSSENAIRGLLMHLCEIPEDQISGLEIPNGLPLIFDVNSKCIKLLDDGTGRDPLEVHNFGNAANYLFRPCQNEDGTQDEECDIRFLRTNDDDEDSSKREQDLKLINEIKNRIKRPTATTMKEESVLTTTTE
mmetsp:Transcript_3745/g.4312  ORF Transcript_3745/g.4312 Transcript_3745/m.4312 type:complete len:852 (+) Transcript_3745:42-2597(+)